MQQFSYMPYGELLVEGSSVDLDYRFSAKETDRETGLSYFGARYYDPSVAMWLGTDPLWEVYVGMNPYNYCAGNPVGLMDLDGRKVAEQSKEDWNSYKNSITEKINELSQQDNPDQERINRLKECLITMNKVEESTQVYSIKRINPKDDFGEIKLNTETDIIELYVGNVSNFVMN